MGQTIDLSYRQVQQNFITYRVTLEYSELGATSSEYKGHIGHIKFC